ncbi:MAG: transglutaminase domain-containing protein [bacterium]|nr:transglutaminase domain-containing protein [bacterium]
MRLRPFFLVLWVALAGCASAPVPADTPIPEGDAPVPAEEPVAPGETREHWFLVEADNTPAGWMLEREIRRDGRLTSVSILHLRFRRGSSEQTLELESRFVETDAGHPISAWARQNLGTRPAETSWEFQRSGVVIETNHGGDSVRKQLPVSHDQWLTPGQIQPRLRRLVAAGAEEFTFRTLDPQLGLELVETEWLLDGRDEQPVIPGRSAPTWRYRQRQSYASHVESVAHVSEDGLVVRSVTPMLGLEMKVTLSRRETVLAARGAPELLTRSFVYPDRPIREPRRVRRARYEIATDSGVLESLPNSGAQRVLDATGAQRVLETPDVSRAVVEVGEGSLHEAEEHDDVAEYLLASSYLDYRHPAVRRLLDDAGLERSEAGSAARAEALRAFVAGYLEDKNLDSVLATASQVAESRSGDCTEHSVLLTALLRAADIPARVVTGLVYAEEFAGERDLFAYHMWSQALIDGRWMDLDATLDRTFDAAHVAFGTSALGDDSSTLAELARLATFIGRVRIRVLDVEHQQQLLE